MTRLEDLHEKLVKSVREYRIIPEGEMSPFMVVSAASAYVAEYERLKKHAKVKEKDQKKARLHPLDPRTLTKYPVVGTCSICKFRQYETPSGAVCANGHGGAPALED